MTRVSFITSSAEGKLPNAPPIPNHMPGHQETQPGFEQVGSPLIRAGTQGDSAPAHVSNPEINAQFDTRPGSTAPVTTEEATLSDTIPAVSTAGSSGRGATFCTTAGDLDHKLCNAIHVTDNNKGLGGHTTDSLSERRSGGTLSHVAVPSEADVVASSLSTRTSHCPSLGRDTGSCGEAGHLASSSTIAPVSINALFPNREQLEGPGTDRPLDKDTASEDSLSPLLQDGGHGAINTNYAVVQQGQVPPASVTDVLSTGNTNHRLSRGSTPATKAPVAEKCASQAATPTIPDVDKTTINALESSEDGNAPVPAPTPASRLSLGDRARAAQVGNPLLRKQASGSQDLHKRGVSKLEGGRSHSNTGQVSRLGSGSGGAKSTSDTAPTQSSAISSAQVRS